MKYLFSSGGLNHFKAFCRERALFAFDYDGTLVGIVENREQAQLTRRIFRLLKDLDRLADVAIISGRGLPDLKKIIPFRVSTLIGNHGSEGIHYPQKKLNAFSRVCRNWKADLLSTIKLGRGIELEDKRYTLTLHYRASSQGSRLRNRFLNRFRQLRPSPRIIASKCAINLIPTGSPNKGDALCWLLKVKKLRRALYIGDEMTDEDVFSLNDKRILTIRVGKKRNSRAQYYIRTQSEIHRVLEAAIELVSPCEVN